MHVHTVQSRDFARDVGTAKRLAATSPVIITDRGRPAFALLRIEDDYELSGQSRERSLLDVMDGIPGGDFEHEPPRMDGEFKDLDFS
ncbi:MAG: prevent-host-death protein [Alphaproteobacteria bacterium]|nr:prevent-host-death protein [Alphaproteobacteria bacterium]